MRQPRAHDLSILQREHASWLRRNFPEMTPHQSIMGLIEELGELSHAQLKGEQKIRGNDDDHRAERMDAVGDLVIFLAGYCTLTNLSLAECVELTWAKVKRRDWVTYPETGQAQ